MDFELVQPHLDIKNIYKTFKLPDIRSIKHLKKWNKRQVFESISPVKDDLKKGYKKTLNTIVIPKCS